MHWKHLEANFDLGAERFDSLSRCLKKKTRKWLQVERNAQMNRYEDCTLMDIYDTLTVTGVFL
jgi:hypothetical protein